VIDLDELRQALHTMRPRTKLFEVVKSELMAQGRWKYLKRGRHAPRAAK
jgi:hypothetical protein